MEKIYGLVADELNGEGINAETYTADDGTQVLRLTSGQMGFDRDGTVLTELEQMEINDKNHCYFQINTVIAKEIPREAYPKILMNLNAMNIRSVMGYYGILDDMGLLYHRYVAKFLNASDEQLAAELVEIIFDVLGVVSTDFDDVFEALG